MLLTIGLLTILLAGVALMAAGIVVLLKSQRKLAGGIMTAIGFAFTGFSVAIFLMLTITTSIQSMG